MVWLTATRTLKLMPHLWHRPQDVIHVPAFIAFGYYFAIMKVYALFTLHETGWGTRTGIGDASAATAAADRMNEKDNEHRRDTIHLQPPPKHNPYNRRDYNQSDMSLSDVQTPTTSTPIYSQRAGNNTHARGESVQVRRRPAEDDTGSLEMQIGYAK